MEKSIEEQMEQAASDRLEAEERNRRAPDLRAIDEMIATIRDHIANRDQFDSQETHIAEDRFLDIALEIRAKYSKAE